jgi:hypothetical protein
VRPWDPSGARRECGSAGPCYPNCKKFLRMVSRSTSDRHRPVATGCAARRPQPLRFRGPRVFAATAPGPLFVFVLARRRSGSFLAIHAKHQHRCEHGAGPSASRRRWRTADAGCTEGHPRALRRQLGRYGTTPLVVPDRACRGPHQNLRRRLHHVEPHIQEQHFLDLHHPPRPCHD